MDRKRLQNEQKRNRKDRKYGTINARTRHRHFCLGNTYRTHILKRTANDRFRRVKHGDKGIIRGTRLLQYRSVSPHGDAGNKRGIYNPCTGSTYQSRRIHFYCAFGVVKWRKFCCACFRESRHSHTCSTRDIHAVGNVSVHKASPMRALFLDDIAPLCISISMAIPSNISFHLNREIIGRAA